MIDQKSRVRLNRFIQNMPPLPIPESKILEINKKENFNALDMDGFWRHSICVGVLAKTFANKQGVTLKLQEEYFVAGLLHDIGKIPLNSQMPEKYLSAMTVSRQNKIPLIEAE